MSAKIRISLIVAVLVISYTGILSADDFKAPVAKVDLKDGDTIVFLGDSITHQCLYTQYVEDFFYTRYPNMRLKFHNAGVGGAKAWDALERLDRDVAAYKPKYVTILLGMNDGTYQPYNEQVFQTYRADMIELVGRISATGATPVLMTPTMYDSRAARSGKRKHDDGKLELYNSVLAYYGTWLREVAVESGYGFVDMYSPLNNLTLAERKTNANFTMIRDAVHPDPPGQLVMAYALLDDLGLRSPLSNIRIQPGKDDKPVARATGGKVTGLKKTENGIEFTWLANGLPFVVPEEAQLGADLVKLGHRMSREAIEVHGLDAGNYELTIDGQSVGVFNNLALSRHVELQSNSKTPQYQQALQVAQLNKERNAGPIKQLRGQWSQFQRHSRASRQLKENPENEQFKKQAETLKSKLEGMEDRISEFEKAALEMEDKIFETNQPKPRNYDLKRVELSATKGHVLLNGEPVVGARVTFTSANGRVATGVTDAKGSYVTRTGLLGGLVPGEYKVSINNSSNRKKLSEAIPAVYSNPQSTVLTVVVKPASPNEFNFELATTE